MGKGILGKYREERIGNLIRRIYDSGEEYWENENKEYHREDGPAITDLNKGLTMYFLNGKHFKTKEGWEQEMWKRNIEKIIGE